MPAFTAEVSPLRVRVRNSFLGLMDGLSTEAYLISVTSIPNRPLFFNVHLETGALFSRLPITALVCDRFKMNSSVPDNLDLADAQPYSCLEGDIQVIEYKYLKNYEVLVRGIEQPGFYLFTVDIVGFGLSDDPIQHKTHNIIVLEDGNMIAYPNNLILLPDKYFADDSPQWPKYKRSDKYYLPGG